MSVIDLVSFSLTKESSSDVDLRKKQIIDTCAKIFTIGRGSIDDSGKLEIALALVAEIEAFAVAIPDIPKHIRGDK